MKFQTDKTINYYQTEQNPVAKMPWIKKKKNNNLVLNRFAHIAEEMTSVINGFSRNA